MNSSCLEVSVRPASFRGESSSRACDAEHIVLLTSRYRRITLIFTSGRHSFKAPNVQVVQTASALLGL